MEYIYYLLIVISILGLLLLFFGRSVSFRETKNRNSARVRIQKDAPVKRKDSTDTDSLASLLVSVRGENARFPTPWGWPGHIGHRGHSAGSGLSRSFSSTDHRIADDSLQQWVDRLMAEKRTVQDREYILRKKASLRALLEDRYGKSAGGYDQVDNNRKTSAERITSSLKRDARQLRDVGSRRTTRNISELQDIRMPWGW